MRLPWKGGSISLRWARWRSSSMTSSEFSPSTGPSGLSSPPACRTCGFSVKTCLISTGSATATNGPKPTSLSDITFP